MGQERHLPGFLPSENRNKVKVPFNPWHLFFLSTVKLGLYKVLGTAMVKDFIIFNILCPPCECAILILQAIAAKILNPRFVTSHQARTQVTKAVPAAVANAIFQQTCLAEEYLKRDTVFTQLTFQGEVSFNDPGFHVYFVTEIISNLFNQ